MKIKFYLLLQLFFMTSSCMAMLPNNLGSAMPNQPPKIPVQGTLLDVTQISIGAAGFIERNPRVIRIINRFNEINKNINKKRYILRTPALVNLMSEYYDIAKKDIRPAVWDYICFFQQMTGVEGSTFTSVMARMRQRALCTLDSEEEKQEVFTEASNLLCDVVVNNHKAMSRNELFQALLKKIERLEYSHSKIKLFCQNKNDFRGLVGYLLSYYSNISKSSEARDLLMQHLKNSENNDQGETMLVDELFNYIKRNGGGDDGRDGGGFGGAMPMVVGE